MIELREAHISDFASIVKLHAESWRQNYRGIYSDNYLDFEVERDLSEAWSEKLNHPKKNQRVTLAIDNDNLLGFSCLFLGDDPVFGSLFDNLHVSKEIQQSGVGRLLVQSCAKDIYHNCKSHKMYLWVYNLNKKAKAFYERLGGLHFETMEKENSDGSTAQCCRYVWEDISILG